ncbi:MAG TPA: M48 family metallopeptidase [Actinomycetota bacterium]
MSSFFYNLGKRAGPAIRKGRWVWSSLSGSEAEARRAERAVGRELAGRTRSRFGVDDDLRDSRLLEEIGFSLVAKDRNADREFSFEPLRGGGMNAFALPGGFVFVTRGLLDDCGRDRDELAFVLAHEIGHVVRGHALERLVGRSALAGVVRALPAAGLLGRLAGRPSLALLESAHSREQEYEADSVGVRLSMSAGFDPSGSSRFLERLVRPERAVVANYLASHPDPEQRIRRIEEGRSPG